MLGQLRRYDGTQRKDGVDPPATIACAGQRLSDGTGQRIIHDMPCALIVDTRLPANPGGDRQRQGVDTLSLFQPGRDRRQQPLRQLLAAVHGDLSRSMSQRRIVKARHQVATIGRDIQFGRRRQGCFRLIPQSLDEGARLRQRQHFVNMIDTSKPA